MKKNFKHSVFKTAYSVTLMSVLVFSASSTTYAAGPSAINLSSSGSFVILTKTGISTTGSTAIVGDIGVSPIGATAITGFSLNLPADNAYSTSPLVTGKVYAPGYANPTSVVLTSAIGDMQTAYTDGAGRTNPTTTELGAGNIGGLTITPGLYKWGTGVTIPSDVTLSGSANDVWIFQIAQTLNVSSGVKVILSGGAQASNVFWVVAGQATIGTTAEVNGTILGQTAIVLNTGARLNGRALAQTAVTLDSSTVTIPSGSPAVVSTPSTPTVVAPTPTPSPVSIQTNTQTTVTGQTSTSVATPITTQQAITTTSRGTYQSSAQVPNFNGASPTLYQASQSTTNLGQGVRVIAMNLRQGNTGNSVKVLQQFLIDQNKGTSARALGRNGTSNYFGPLTRRALAEFQASVGISPSSGNFGRITKEYIRANY
ncbi:DUF3494 domain-containing protein [Arenimonas sp.]|nr:DUF3494 domain-containing protein [Candidatus Parcubacteria bacterium]